MKKCKSCQTEIDSKAKKCPHCQADQRNWFVKHKILTGILAIIFITIIANMGGNKNSTTDNNKTEQKDSSPSTINKPFNIEVTSQIVKKVDKKYRYFFDIRNKDNKPFKGEVKISLYKSDGNRLGEKTFNTTKEIEPNLGNSVYVDINSGPTSEWGTEGISSYKYEVIINNKTVKTDEGKIINKVENLD